MVAVWNGVVILVLLLIHAALGYQLLGRTRWQGTTWLETALSSAAISFGLTSLAMFSLGISGTMNPSAVMFLLVLLSVLAGSHGWKAVVSATLECKEGVIRTLKSRSSATLLLLITAVLALGALSASAPLIGSDAMVYHFDVPRLYTKAGQIFPVYWNIRGFFIGSGHMLTLLGMTIGNDRTALALCYLGGLLSAGATYSLARRFLSLNFALLTVALFVVAPMTFWQLGGAGTPDMWTTFFTVMSVTFFANWLGRRDQGSLVLCGFSAGIAASSKYTGWATPLVLMLMLACHTRASVKAMTVFGVPLLAASAWRHIANLVWTGDPFFPFLSNALGVSGFNAYTYQGTLGDIKGRGFSLNPLSVLIYPLRLVLEGSRFGDGHYFGPVILSVSPIIFSSATASKLKSIGLFCLGVFVANSFTSQAGRFLLPIFPLVLILSVNALTWLNSQPRLKLAKNSCNAMVCFFILFATFSDVIYAKDFLPVAIGRETESAFLRRMAPDYNVSEYVNQYLSDKPGLAMVFFRHTYYLSGPFISGDPDISWVMTPQKTGTPESLHGLLRDLGVRWVVKAGDYPGQLRSVFGQLETQGGLEKVASQEVENFSGYRIYRRRERIPVTILKLNPTVEAVPDSSKAAG